MKTICQVTLFIFAALFWIASASAVAGELVYSQYSDGQSTYGPSLVWSADSVSAEVADDFKETAL